MEALKGAEVRKCIGAEVRRRAETCGGAEESNGAEVRRSAEMCGGTEK